MHIIEICQTITDTFDVLINGNSYRVHRGFNFDQAMRRANEIKQTFAKMGERSITKGASHVA